MPCILSLSQELTFHSRVEKAKGPIHGLILVLIVIRKNKQKKSSKLKLKCLAQRRSERQFTNLKKFAESNVHSQIRRIQKSSSIKTRSVTLGSPIDSQPEGFSVGWFTCATGSYITFHRSLDKPKRFGEPMNFEITVEIIALDNSPSSSCFQVYSKFWPIRCFHMDAGCPFCYPKSRSDCEAETLGKFTYYSCNPPLCRCEQNC